MKNTNKGFTLIELLAVIQILATISLIVMPVVLGIIGKSKLRAAELSGLDYVNAIEKQIMLNIMDGDEQTKDGFYEYNEIPVSLKGQTPNSGWFKIEKGQVSDYSLIINGYIVSKDDKTVPGTTAKPKAYSLGELVYFDPVSTDKCDEKSVSTTCYKWRVIETADTKSKMTITLQMNHNLINKSAWAPSESNTTGPITALEELNEKTKTWTRIEPLNYEYDTSAATSNYGKMSCTNGNCTLNGNAVEGTAKARMITGEEVRDITNTKVTDPNMPSKKWTVARSWGYYFYFSNTGRIIGKTEIGKGDTDLAWLVENTINFAESGATSNGTENNGYWTLSPVSDVASESWHVDHEGILLDSAVTNDQSYGVRPVITILKSNI